MRESSEDGSETRERTEWGKSAGLDGRDSQRGNGHFSSKTIVGRPRSREAWESAQERRTRSQRDGAVSGGAKKANCLALECERPCACAPTHDRYAMHLCGCTVLA